ncbi:hypothetical protein ACFPVT_04020 [Corynebacterium choanae]|uniref:hypothetical protein n=1 Tax=Corynebacterium choanae TaxID=1862358 RepID=UPI001FE4CDD6|nr:hypothetical protein [Corynebacterium choanae]
MAIFVSIIFPPTAYGVDGDVAAMSKLYARADPLVLVQRSKVPTSLAQEPSL